MHTLSAIVEVDFRLDFLLHIRDKQIIKHNLCTWSLINILRMHTLSAIVEVDFRLDVLLHIRDK